MPVALYDISVPTYRHFLGTLASVLEKGRAHCEAEGIDPAELLQARLAPDMLPLGTQIQIVWLQSIGALEALKSGSFTPSLTGPLADYAAMQAHVAEALHALDGYSESAVNACAETDVMMRGGGVERLFTATNYILFFSVPNFYFHVTTAYDILRHNGVPLGKADFLGAMPTKG